MTKVVIEYRNIEDINPYEKNPRKNEDAVRDVAESIRHFGFKVPIIVDKEGVIIAGHTRLKAAKKLGMTEVPVIQADDLTEEQAKAFRVADNKVAERSLWDIDILKDELADLDDIFTGFSDDELAELFEEEEIIEEEEPEVEFTEELGEENNYVVLFFDNSVDWLQAQSLLGLKTVKALDSKPGYSKQGVGRVMNGTDFLNLMLGGE